MMGSVDPIMLARSLPWLLVGRTFSVSVPVQRVKAAGQAGKKGPRPPEEDCGLIARRCWRQQRSYLAGASAVPF